MAEKQVTPGMRQRRELAADLAAAAALAALLLSLAAGLGVVAVIALPAFLLLLLWAGVERLARGRRRGSARNSHRSFRKAPKDEGSRV